MTIEELHRNGDCGFDCPACAEDTMHELTHDLIETTEGRECKRCGMTDFQSEVSTKDCVDASLNVVARPGLVTETIYVNPDGSAFWTPDGVGCYFYDTEDEALTAAGEPEDWDVEYLDRKFVQ